MLPIMNQRTQTDLNDKPLTDLDEIEAELHDPKYWDWDSTVVGLPSPHPSISVGVRLAGEEARLVGDDARKAGMPVSRYLLHAALENARRDLETRDKPSPDR